MAGDAACAPSPASRELSRAELPRRPGPLAPPQRPRRLARGPRRRRPEARRGGGRGRHPHRRRPPLPLPPQPPRPPRSSRSPSSRTGETGDRPGRGPRHQAAPLPPPRPDDHLASKSATTAVTSGPPGSTSPGSPRSSTPAPGSCSPASVTKRGFGVTEYEVLSGGGGEGEAGLPQERSRPSSSPSTRRPRHLRRRSGSGTGPSRRARWAPNAIEGLPAELRARRGLAGVGDAIRAAHFPETAGGSSRRRCERLGFEELFLYQALLATRKRTHRAARPAPRLGEPGELVGRWLDSLPFEPTGDQLAAFDEIDADLDSGEPMQRLLMGEVGSGKTVVAVYAMLRALEAGYQAVLMAPTETLAEQHAVTLGRLLAAEAIPFALLTGATPAATRQRALDQLASGELGLILGTHALIEPTVGFARLGLCVVDEQHRFGVEQRRALDAKGVEGMAPHVLHMTATPIPRTLSLTAYGDLDTTALHELPAGPQAGRDAAGRGGASAPAPTSSCASGCARAARPSSSARWSRSPRRCRARRPRSRPSGCARASCATSRSASCTGRCPRPRRRRRCAAFAAGETDVLVATTVIEVGIDVAQRDRDGDRGGRALRRLPAAPAARPGRARRAPLALPAVRRRGGGDGAAAAAGGGRRARRLQARRGRPRAARRGRDPRHPPARPAALRRRRAARGHADPARRPRGGAGPAARATARSTTPRSGPLLDAARRRFGAGAADPIPL